MTVYMAMHFSQQYSELKCLATQCFREANYSGPLALASHMSSIILYSYMQIYIYAAIFISTMSLWPNSSLLHVLFCFH